MKYAVVVTYASQRTGAVIEAESRKQAWERVGEIFNLEYTQAIELVEILTEDRGA